MRIKYYAKYMFDNLVKKALSSYMTFEMHSKGPKNSRRETVKAAEFAAHPPF